MNLIIIGTGLFAEVASDYFEDYSEYRVVAFSCHRRFIEKEELNGLPIVAIEDLVGKYPSSEYKVFVAVGYAEMNELRESIYNEVKDLGYECVTFIHPDVKIWKSTEIEDNVFVFEDNTVQPYTKLGRNTILWSGNHIGHHTKIGANCFISSHVVISGSCVIGNNVFIGVNATLRDSIRIADKTLIGAGALVMKNTKEKEVLVADRTLPYKKNSEEVRF